MDYLARAAKFGQDVEAIKSGKIVTSEVIVNSIDEYRDLFAADQSDIHRAAYEANRPTDNSIEPVLEQAMAYVFGQQEKTPDIEHTAGLVFPLPVLVTTATNITLSTDQVIGPQSPSYALNAGTLTFDGGSLTINSTVSNISADNLVIVANPSHPSQNTYHIGIVGNKGADGQPVATPGTYPGTAGSGSNGGDPVWGTCTSSGIGGTGNTGAQGYPGNTGNHGMPGIASLQSVITITAFDPSNINAFVVETYSGAGGAGGKGGTGGQGQKGGTGGKGCSSGCEGSDGGRGGTGGKGGTGGTGGNGGDAAQGFPITINFPRSASTMLSTMATAVPPGAAGDKGDGGAGGVGGDGGSGGKHSSNGKAGGTGPGGDQGAVGTASSVSGAPGNISKNFT